MMAVTHLVPSRVGTAQLARYGPFKPQARRLYAYQMPLDQILMRTKVPIRAHKNLIERHLISVEPPRLWLEGSIPCQLCRSHSGWYEVSDGHHSTIAESGRR